MDRDKTIAKSANFTKNATYFEECNVLATKRVNLAPFKRAETKVQIFGKEKCKTLPRSAGDEAWRRGENAWACRAALGLKKIARADHHDILEKRRLGNADADCTRASESRRSDAVEFYWSQTSSTAPIFSLEI